MLWLLLQSVGGPRIWVFDPRVLWQAHPFDVRQPRRHTVFLEVGPSFNPIIRSYPFCQRLNIINVVKRIHDAGVVHGGFGVFDVLIANAKPFIANFKNASEKVCERRMDIVKGAITPKRELFGCTELYRLCVDLQIWKPRMLLPLSFGYVQLTHSLL